MDQMRNAIINYVQNQFWAIEKHMLDLIYEVLHAKYFLNDNDRVKQLTEFKVKNPDNDIRGNRTEKRVAIIPVVGIVGKRFNMVGDISTKGVSTDIIKQQISMALNDSEIDAMVLDMDSPGGTIAGTKELSDYIHSVRGKKPIIAHANELCCSAAYWIASAADKVFASETARVGNVGVYTVHFDFSKADEQKGVKRTFIYAGKYKTLGNDAEPLAGESKAILQKDVDLIFTKFVDSVAKNRNIDKEIVTKDAKALFAEEALDRGLIDRIATLEEAVNYAANMVVDQDEIKQIEAMSEDRVLSIEKISIEEVFKFDTEHLICCE